MIGVRWLWEKIVEWLMIAAVFIIVSIGIGAYVLFEMLGSNRPFGG